jgi:hypothetical protein
MDDQFPCCSRCGDRIGVYERIWVQHEDGALEESAFLRIRISDLARPIRLFHGGCLVPDTVREASG